MDKPFVIDNTKIGSFIKKLREKNNMSQEQLADRMNCDRTKVNKIETGNRSIQMGDLILLKEIFNVDYDEIIAGEYRTSDNEEQIQITFGDYLKAQNTKSKRNKIALIISVILLFILSFLFLFIYFTQNYSSVRVYRIGGHSENYDISDGILILSKDKIYFKINEITPEVDVVCMYSEIDRERKFVFEGAFDAILNDFYGTDEIVSYEEFINNKQDFYIVIGDEEIKLKFDEYFRNNKIIYGKKRPTSNEDSEREEVYVPEKIKEDFECDEYGNCSLVQEGYLLTYAIGIFVAGTDDCTDTFTFFENSNNLVYENGNGESFTWKIDGNTGICIEGDCDKVEDKYKYFYDNFYLKYFSE